MTSVLAREPTPASYFGKGRAGCVVKRLQMLLCAPRPAPSAGAAGQGRCQCQGCGSGAVRGSFLHPTVMGAVPRGKGSPGTPPVQPAWCRTIWVQPLHQHGEGHPGTALLPLHPSATTSLCHRIPVPPHPAATASLCHARRAARGPAVGAAWGDAGVSGW